jgi:predicted acetyltransferase
VVTSGSFAAVEHDIRVLTDPGEILRALEVFCASVVFMAVPTGGGEITEYAEPGRTLGAFVDGTMVGTAASFTSSLVVPGGARLPHAAVTDIGVLPTHTRRGLAGALIRRQLGQIAARGEIVATLRASEAVIYERFGYGIATSVAAVEVTVAGAKLRPGIPAGGPVRFVDPKTSWDLLAGICTPADRPGAIERYRYWWNGVRYAVDHDKGANYVVVHGPTGAEDGFVRYHPIANEHWFSSRDRAIAVRDFVANTVQAQHELLRFLLSIDLLHRIELQTLPVDHSIEKLVFDERAVRTTIRDETWLRLIDVEAALDARSYRGPGSVVIGVTDVQLPSNSGNYVVSADGAKRTDATAQLSVDVAALATVYLGGTRWWQLASAGRVHEHEAGALSVAEELFATDRPPYCGTMF